MTRNIIGTSGHKLQAGKLKMRCTFLIEWKATVRIYPGVVVEDPSLLTAHFWIKGLDAFMMVFSKSKCRQTHVSLEWLYNLPKSEYKSKNALWQQLLHFKILSREEQTRAFQRSDFFALHFWQYSIKGIQSWIGEIIVFNLSIRSLT